jgi:tetratricopeptide (TPR) repeat protein
MPNPVFRNLVTLVVVLCFFVSPAAALEKQAEYTNPAVGDKNSASYWLDRGGLLATYGNYKAAVAAYTKALELDATLSQAHFDLGVAYGEMADFDQALRHINAAIELSPGIAHYYYGRARVLLLAGQRSRALEDFRKAADMGDPDAEDYLGK